MTTDKNNPLLQSQPAERPFPAFDAIKPDHVKPALEARIEACKVLFDEVVEAGRAEGFRWDNFAAPIEEVSDVLDRTWSPVSHLNAVMSTPELREAHDACLPMLAEFGTYAGQHQGLYEGYQALKNSPEFAKLTTAQRKTIDDALRDFKLSGVALPEDKKKRYAEIQSQLSELS